MGATREWKQGRHAVAVAAVLFYAFLASWLPVNLGAPTDAFQQASVVFNIADDGDEDLLAGAGDLAPSQIIELASFGRPLVSAAEPQTALHAHGPLVSRARDPPVLKV